MDFAMERRPIAISFRVYPKNLEGQALEPRELSTMCFTCFVSIIWNLAHLVDLVDLVDLVVLVDLVERIIFIQTKLYLFRLKFYGEVVNKTFKT